MNKILDEVFHVASEQSQEQVLVVLFGLGGSILQEAINNSKESVDDNLLHDEG